MPRVKFKGGVTAGKLTRDQVIEGLRADPFGVLMDDQDHVLLTPFTPAERTDILHTVERRQWAAREAERLPILLERLRTWPPDSWGDVFCERPDLEASLTPAQKARWTAFARGNRPAARATGGRAKPDGERRPRLIGKTQ
jgi:hypothetical protein